jgi:hypothetical protein
VQILDDDTLLIPDRPGNNHLDSIEISETGHSLAQHPTRKFDPLLPFGIGPANGREASESGLRLRREARQERACFQASSGLDPLSMLRSIPCPTDQRAAAGSVSDQRGGMLGNAMSFTMSFRPGA